jgi:hypothetical protein
MSNTKLKEFFRKKSYFNDVVYEKFNIEREEEFEELLKILRKLIKITQDEIIFNRISTKSRKDLSEPIKIDRKEFLENFEKNLQNIGFISKKSRKYLAEEGAGELYKYLVNEKSRNVYIEIDKIEKKFFKERDLYKSFKRILKKIFNKEKITICETANLGMPGKWANPDILVKFDNFYYSYELKRWKNISLVAPHEARNHARYISNYPYVVINMPQEIFEFVIEYTDSFQIIKNDCKERGIGLILFDEVNEKILKLLDADYFTPDPLKKIKYEKLINEKCVKEL